MSRIPQPRSTPRSTPTKAPEARIRTKSTAKLSKPSATKPPPSSQASVPEPDVPRKLSIKEAIALKRAQAKAAEKLPGDFASLEFASPEVFQPAEPEDILGRLPLRETIERARTTGTLNIATRSLLCLPSALFEIHLAVTPEPLQSVPNEPKLPPVVDETLPRHKQRDSPAWFDNQDLTVLKAWHNEIVEIQPEISLFGSLQILDLHKNKIASLPITLCDLSCLVTLDLSNNQLRELPENLFSLPKLTTLNLSHNLLDSLPFSAPFLPKPPSFSVDYGGIFGSTVIRASNPLPLLTSLDVSHNKILAKSIDSASLPTGLSKVNLSTNPLGFGSNTAPLIAALGKLSKLKELLLEKAEIDDAAFSSSESPSFSTLCLLDLGETRATQTGVTQALQTMKVRQTLNFDNEELPGALQVRVGKRMIKEAWEIEMERNTGKRSVWISQEQPEAPSAAAVNPVKRKPEPPRLEDWEIEAQQGLLTEGGRRRARAAAAAAALEKEEAEAKLAAAKPATVASLTHSQYYSASQLTLTLPPSAPPSKLAGRHARTFSLAPSAANFVASDVTIPTPTLPLTVIAAQGFAQTLRILILKNRRMDRSFSLPSTIEQPLLPQLIELSLEGCSLTNEVTVSYDADVMNVKSKAIIPLLASLFPNLRVLDLSHNTLTGAAFTKEALMSLLVVNAPTAQGLRSLLLRGNRIESLDGFQQIAESMFTGHRHVAGWCFDELDIRDNEIRKIPYELGLLPLEVLLVEGNILPAPQKRIAEREGTKGLLVYLRGCIGT